MKKKCSVWLLLVLISGLPQLTWACADPRTYWRHIGVVPITEFADLNAYAAAVYGGQLMRWDDNGLITIWHQMDNPDTGHMDLTMQIDQEADPTLRCYGFDILLEAAFHYYRSSTEIGPARIHQIVAQLESPGKEVPLAKVRLDIPFNRYSIVVAARCRNVKAGKQVVVVSYPYNFTHTTCGGTAIAATAEQVRILNACANSNIEAKDAEQAFRDSRCKIR